MTQRAVVGFSGNANAPSKTRRLVEEVVEVAASAHGLRGATYDVADLGPSFRAADWASQLDEKARAVLRAVIDADLLVVGSATYKGSYTGLFKHFFDLIKTEELAGKVVIVAATGGNHAHSLVIEHQYRPLFGFFGAFVVPSAIYAVDADFADGALASAKIREQITQAVMQAGALLPSPER